MRRMPLALALRSSGLGRPAASPGPGSAAATSWVRSTASGLSIPCGVTALPASLTPRGVGVSLGTKAAGLHGARGVSAASAGRGARGAAYALGPPATSSIVGAGRLAAASGRRSSSSAASNSVPPPHPFDPNEKSPIDSSQPTREQVLTGSPRNNVTEAIFSKIGSGLHRREGHPLQIIKGAIYDHFTLPGVRASARGEAAAGTAEAGGSGAASVATPAGAGTGDVEAASASSATAAAGPPRYETFDDLSPLVTVAMNFDEVLVPEDHVSRDPNDTYYVDEDRVLRCHTSAHQAQLLRAGFRAFLVTGDVYRRDSIDATHYPVFHQMEGFRVFDEAELTAALRRDAAEREGGGEGERDAVSIRDAEGNVTPAASEFATAYAAAHLKATLEGLTHRLFGPVEMRWVDAYFPFTDPSFELEIFFNGQWLEVLGCGVTIQSIVDENRDLAAGASGEGSRGPDARRPLTRAWAFGLGLERLAMVLFGIPDIRLFWSDDERFTRQFEPGRLSTKFVPFSKHPPCYKDVAFWVPASGFRENDLCELVRGIAGDLVEEVTLIDAFTHPKTGRESKCYRIVYRAMDRNLTDEEINALQTKVREEAATKLGVELR